MQDRDAAENALQDYHSQCSETKPDHPAAFFDPPHPDRNNDGEKAHQLRNHAMGVLELHATDEMGNFVKRTK